MSEPESEAPFPRHPDLRLARVLLAEDDPDDADMLRRALDRSHLALDLRWARDGEEALELLRSGVEIDLVLLDLNMPKLNGHEVLAQIRAHPRLGNTPVVILTTSHSERDVSLSYELRANAYVVKPLGLNGFTKVMEAIDGFWFSVAVLPPRTA